MAVIRLVFRGNVMRAAQFHVITRLAVFVGLFIDGNQWSHVLSLWGNFYHFQK